MIHDFQQLFSIWTDRIPLVRAMHIEFHESHAGWSLQAPLAPNVNHMGTGFGGSIAALATLAGWAQTWMLLPAPDAAHIVVANSTIRYLKPATDALIATADVPNDDAIQHFLDRLHTKGRAGIELSTRITSNGLDAATFNGKFVATAKSDHEPTSGLV